MSTDEYNRKVEETKKLLTVLKKDIRYREDQQKRGQTTYSLDAEIKGSFSELNQVISRLQQIISNFRANPKDFGLTNRELEKRVQQLNQLAADRGNLQRTYDSFFQKKASSGIFDDAPKQKTNYQNMNSGQLYDHKKKLQEKQEDMIDEIIGVVKNTKEGQKNVERELDDHKELLNQVDAGMDDNIKNMGKVRRNMVKLLEESSNCCLVAIIVIELVAVFCIIFLWN